MKTAKWAACSLAVALVFILTATPTVQAGQGLTIWPLDPAAKGDRSTGQLTIYYELDGADCPHFPEPMAKMIFLLKLYDKNAKQWHIITHKTAESYCLTWDVGDGTFIAPQQQALLDFLGGPVLNAIGSSYGSVVLKDVEDDYENLTGDDYTLPLCVSAEITVVAQ